MAEINNHTKHFTNIKDICRLCKQATETPEHLIWHCEAAGACSRSYLGEYADGHGSWKAEDIIKFVNEPIIKNLLMKRGVDNNDSHPQ